MRKHTWRVPLVPGSVRAARERTERSLDLFGLESGGDVRVEPAADRPGKTVVVRFIPPEGTP
ncbi:hypothetical protein [Streptomyces sp. NPDC049949]|uniref:hypothetical protein n=1 Tax=Streptomyces sp. NPDC049949 TaxID=3154627 RepID=UPI00343FE37C